ncbi:G-type lectin S-receptor-like serine/threonine-protein kinase [Nymphaea thermarum]|nr:G-type lectin S-receptor-like serine/threonine-protein kinase [Nymphaea thermarum]
MEVFMSLLCLFFFMIRTSLFPLAQAQVQPYNNITLGSSLSSVDKQSFWTSPSGEFSFGFSTFDGSLYVGIWFEKVSGKPLVWTANRDSQAPSGSTVELTTDGRLLLKDEKKAVLMTIANSSDGDVGSAAMLNNGNFILQSRSGDIKWQSFDHPTDTILPEQSLGPESVLYAAASETDISTGRYFLKMQSDGNLVISWSDSPTDVSNDAYSSNTEGTPGRLMFATTGAIYISIPNGTRVNLTPSDRIPTPAKGFYQRAKVGYDGVFRQYSYPKNDNGNLAQSWGTVWSTQANSCFVPGICGLNGYCFLKNDGQPDCLCPKGFNYVNPSNRFMGCRQNFPVQECPGLTTNDYVFETLENLDWPKGDFLQMNNVEESKCREACLSDCLCTVAIYMSNTCWKKKIPLYNGRIDLALGSKVLIKMPKENISMTPLPNNKNMGETKCKKDTRNLSPLIILLFFILGGSALLNLFCVILLALLRRRRTKLGRTEPGQSDPVMNLRRFTYKELEDATCGFKEQLGRGSFGTVYKGILSPLEGQKPVAVKQLDKLMEDGEMEFKTEVSVIGRTHHKNLVQLLGYCDEGSQRMLVYEYLERGSLSSFLLGSTRPSWERRVQIIFGVARGLTYLHEECSNPIIHCDIKPENILLNHNFVPKISDFGLAKLLMSDQSHTHTNIRGTKGYMASEWFRQTAITAKVDVYSFGVILLEIICCRKNVELKKKDEESAILVYWANDCFIEHRLERLVENDEAALDDMTRVKKMVMVALWCTQDDPSLRPTMKKVEQMLEDAVEVEVPPYPSVSAAN